MLLTSSALSNMCVIKVSDNSYSSAVLSFEIYCLDIALVTAHDGYKSGISCSAMLLQT